MAPLSRALEVQHCPKCRAHTRPVLTTVPSSPALQRRRGAATEAQREAVTGPGLGGTRACRAPYITMAAARPCSTGPCAALWLERSRGSSLPHCSREGSPARESNLGPRAGPRKPAPRTDQKTGRRAPQPLWVLAICHLLGREGKSPPTRPSRSSKLADSVFQEWGSTSPVTRLMPNIKFL